MATQAWTPQVQRTRPPVDTESGTVPLAQRAFGSYARTTKIDPANDLRSQQITPGADPRLRTTQGQVDQARDQVASFSGYTPYVAPQTNDNYTQEANQYRSQAAGAVPSGVLPATDTSGAQRYLDQAGSLAGQLAGMGGGGVNYGADTGSVRTQLASTLAGLNGPDRSALASQAFKLMQEQAQPGRDLAFRQVGQKAAALGRIGAGMTTNDLTGLQQDITRQDNLTQRDLALQAAQQTLADRLGVAGAVQSGFGALAGADQAAADIANQGNAQRIGAASTGLSALRGLSGDALQLGGVARSDALGNANLGFQRADTLSGLARDAFGQGSDLRSENRLDQGNAFDREQATFGARRQQLGDLSGLEGQQFDQGLTNRNELRSERDYQTNAANQALQNRVDQTLLEDRMLGSEFNRGMDTAGLYNQLGWGYDPTGTLGGQAGQYQNEANQGYEGVGDWLAQYMAQQGRDQGLGDWVSQPTAPNARVVTSTPWQPTLRPAPTTLPRYGGR